MNRRGFTSKVLVTAIGVLGIKGKVESKEAESFNLECTVIGFDPNSFYWREVRYRCPECKRSLCMRQDKTTGMMLASEFPSAMSVIMDDLVRSMLLMIRKDNKEGGKNQCDFCRKEYAKLTNRPGELKGLLGIKKDYSFMGLTAKKLKFPKQWDKDYVFGCNSY